MINNIDCKMVQMINNIDNMKKIAKENEEIIDQLEIDLEGQNIDDENVGLILEEVQFIKNVHSIEMDLKNNIITSKGVSGFRSS